MNLTDRQGFCLTTAFLLGNVLANIGGITQNSKTGYLSVLFSYLLFGLLVGIYHFVFSKNNYRDFFSVTEEVCGHFFHTIILIVIALYSFLAAFFSITNYMHFIAVSTAQKTPQIVTLIPVLLLIVYLAFRSEKTMGRYAEITLPIILIAIIFLILCGIKECNFSHLENIREWNFPEFLKTGATTFLTPFSEIIYTYILFDRLENKKHMTRIALLSGGVLTIIFAVMYLFNLLVLGKELLGTLSYPTFYAASVVKVGTFTEKAETLITFSYSFCDLLYGAVCLSVCCKAVSRIFKNSPKAKKITALPAVISVFIVFCCSENGTRLEALLPIVTYLFIPFTVGLPVLLLAGTLRKSRHR